VNGEDEGRYIDGSAKVSANGRYVFYQSYLASSLGVSQNPSGRKPVLIDLHTGVRTSPTVSGGTYIGTNPADIEMCQLDPLGVSNSGTKLLIGMYPGSPSQGCKGILPGDNDSWYEVYLDSAGTRTRLSQASNERVAGTTFNNSYSGESSILSEDGSTAAIVYPSSSSNIGIYLVMTDTPTVKITLDTKVYGYGGKMRFVGTKLFWYSQNPDYGASSENIVIRYYDLVTQEVANGTIGIDGSLVFDVDVKSGGVGSLTDPSGRYLFFVTQESDKKIIYRRDLQEIGRASCRERV
jgi:hypothetical protein